MDEQLGFSKRRLQGLRTMLPLKDIAAGKGLVPPVHLQSPLFKGYKYPHDYPNHYVRQQYLPDDLKGKKYYTFGENKTEKAAEEYWKRIKGEDQK